MKLRDAWCRETSSDPDNWTPENPAWGQCAVSALIIQDLLGGELLRTTVQGVSHYYNRTENHELLDVTLEQFRSNVGLFGPTEVRTREYVLSFPDTARRYELLKSRVNSD